MDNNYTLRLSFLTAMAWIMPTADVVAQSVEQSFQLQQGWNSVYLEVDPAPETANELFAGLPIRAVWMLSPNRRSLLPPECIDAEDIEDPSCTPIRESGWRVWFPPHEPHHVINSLRIIRGGRVYLIQAGAETSWTVIGKPDSSKTRWRKGYNLVGFHVTEEATATPTFRQYLSGSAVLGNSVIYEIKENGGFARITEPAKTRIKPGRGYWVSASAATRYDGPLRIDEGSLRGINLAPGVVEHRIKIENLAASSSPVTLANVSGNHSASRSAATVGGVPLVFMDYGDGSDAQAVPQWRPLQQETWTLDPAGQPQSSKVLRVALDHGDLGTTGRRTHGKKDPNQRYAGFLVIRNDTGFARMVPLTASTGTQAGLWVGAVTVNEVLWVTDPDISPNCDPADDGCCDPNVSDCLSSTSSEFTFRIIVHRDASPTPVYKLLTEATLVLQAGGGLALVTPDCPQLLTLPAALQTNEPSPRVSTAAFSFDDDLTLTGNFDSTLTATIPIPLGHALNPFQHSYHPDHECVKKRCDNSSPVDMVGRSCDTNDDCAPGACVLTGGGCVVITRQIKLTFDDAADPAAGGIYNETIPADETISELHKDTIKVQGRFDLRKISDINALCTAQQPLSQRNK